MEVGYCGPELSEVTELEGTDEFDPFEVVECVEENVENVPEAPPETQWYHGRLERALAEERLRQSGKPGSYLIRESDRRPGAYVLSFYGKTGMVHFKVTAVCGAFYVGGREFESLSVLIGYYTGWSDLLKGERLAHPVPPPEYVKLVFRKRRVQAVSSYTKSLETDELSFMKGEMFVVLNDMGDEWLWATSLKTEESGIINQKLVVDILDDVDPVEQFPWFHPNITKEEAAEKLANSGPGSWLVKRSDSSGGDFSIYFYCKCQIQRFKIQKMSPSTYHMGGRSFKSVAEVIKRYQSEHIVEGAGLERPVLRITDASPEPDELVTKGTSRTAIKQSTGSNFFLNRKDVVVIKGQLNKKTQKTKKWRRMYFVLNGTEQQLYYFDTEKRSKPKGLIELPTASLYPVHDSLFGRPNVFQLLSRGLNQAHLCYLCADSLDEAQGWVRALKPYCLNTKGTSPALPLSPAVTELRSLQITIYDMGAQALRNLSQLYCIVSLNDLKVCRTRVVQADSCCWDETFRIEDIPCDVDYFLVSVYNKEKMIRDKEISNLKFPVDKLTPGKLTEDRHPLLRYDKVSLRVGMTYLHEIIMSLPEYAQMREILLKNSMEHIQTLSTVCRYNQDRVSLATSLLHLFRHEGLEVSLLNKFLELDIDNEGVKENLFRGDSFGTALMDQYMKMVSTAFLQSALQETINKILKQMSDASSEVDINAKNVIPLLSDVVQHISSSVQHLPMVLRQICGFLQKKVIEKWPMDPLVKTRVISAFIFLRLLCPALINPRQFNLITEAPSQMAVRTLKHVANCLIKLANLTEYKETGMESINQFIHDRKSSIIVFIDNISNVPNVTTNPTPYTVDVPRCLATIHQICSSHLEDLRGLASSQASAKIIIDVTESLTCRKRLRMNQ